MTMAVTAPTKPGTYYIVDNMHMRFKPMPQFWALATIHVEGHQATEPPPNLTQNGPIPDLYTVTADQHRTFQWSIVDDALGRASFPINGYLFPDSPLVPIQVGQVEEWLLVNTSGDRPRLPPSPDRLRRHSRRLERDPDRGQQHEPVSLHVVTRLGRHPARLERDHPFSRQPRARQVRVPLPHPPARRRRDDDGRHRPSERLAAAVRARFDSRSEDARGREGRQRADHRTRLSVRTNRPPAASPRRRAS